MKILLSISICILMSSSLYGATERIAIIIGNNKGLINEDPLVYATRDASEMNATLTSIGNFDKDRVYLLLDQPVSSITSAFKEVTGRIKELKLQQEKVMLFIYFSGHGSDGAIHVNGNKIEISQFREYYSSIDADLKLLIIDACYSGAMLDIKGGTIAPPVTVEWEEPLQTKGSIVITSSSRGEQSHESMHLKGSLFTSYFLSGLKGAADYDRNGQVSLWEAFSYANTSTTISGIHQNVIQHPGFSMDISGTKDVYLSNLSKSQAILEFRDCNGGIYDIIDEQSLTLCARIRLNDNDTTRMALPSRPYIIRHDKQDRLLLASVDLTWGGKKNVDKQSLKSYPSDTFLKKGFTPVFKHNAIHMSIHLLNGVPTGKWTIPHIGYSYTFFNSDLSIMAGYFRDQLHGKFNLVNRNILSGIIQGNYYIFNRSRFAAGLGLQFRYGLLDQQPIRYNEAELINAGYKELPQYTAHITGLFFPLSMYVTLPGSFYTGISVGPGAYLASTPTSELKTYPGFTTELKFGVKFSLHRL